MIGLSLAGGGVRGAYQVGAYYAFKKCHIKFNGFVGTSIGAFNAAMLAAGKDKELLEFWQNVDVGKICGFRPEYIEKLNNQHKSNNVFYHLFQNIKDIIVNKGFSTEGLEEVLEKIDLEQDLRKSKKDFGLVTVRAKDFKALYKFKEDIPKGKLNDYIIASCYLPLFKMEKIIDDTYYLDGGFYDNSPTNMLLDKGYEKVYVVELSAVGVKRKVKDKDKVIVIKPSRNLKSILNTNIDDIRYNIKLGYYDTMRVLKHFDGSTYIFKSFNNWLYSFLMRKVDNKVLKEVERLFGTEDPRTLVIKSLEHVMRLGRYEYANIYNPLSVIKEIQKQKQKYGVYKFINQLKLL